MRKRFFFIALIVLLAQVTKAQNINRDSLWRVFETTQNDSSRLLSLTILHNNYIGLEIDSNFSYCNRLKQNCDRFNIPRYNALGILYASYVFIRIRDFNKVQEQITKAAAIGEKYKDEEVLARVENFRNLVATDPNEQILHLRKAIAYKKALTVNDQLSTIFLGNMSGTFLRINQTDSAFFYAQKMYEMSVKLHDTLSSFVTTVMGNVYLQMNQPDIAYAFFKKGIRITMQSNTIGNLSRAYMAIGNYFEKTNQIDSAVFYWKKHFSFGPKETFGAKITASRKLYEYYLQNKNNDSAIKYVRFYLMANDSTNSANKIAQLQVARFADLLQQQELAKTQAEEKESREHNIQLSVTAIAILTAIILFLLLSSSVIINHRIVAFLSVVVLLVVFEFINLLIHPWLEKITHHSPVLMLLGLVALAAMLVPFHHKLEKWTTGKLVAKNKAIRLANAQKTIEELKDAG